MTVKTTMDQETEKNVNLWLSGSYDESTKTAIKELQQNNPQELIDAFYQRLSFGTGGLRGLMGVGTNRMNRYTVAFATQGLANYIHKLKIKNPKVLISYDSRLHSKELAVVTAEVLSANQIEVLLYQEMRPVALVSFGVLKKGCIAGIMITASHNPPRYNGYKVWWSDGVQVLPPHDSGIIDEVNQINEPSLVKWKSTTSALITEIGTELDGAYLAQVRALQLRPAHNRGEGKNLKIIYSPLHGTGLTLVPKLLADWGFTNLSLVEKQCVPDGNFPTVKSPNPEDREALTLGIEQLTRERGDIFLATDPDADRLAVVAMHDQKPCFFNGNETACLLLEYICEALADRMPQNPCFVKTIVTTELFKAIAEHYGATCLDVLTGFKYIGEKIAQWEEDHTHHYIFGGEESYGYLYGTHARDKDAIICSALICEMASYLKAQGKTLVDLLNSLYTKYGVYREQLASLNFEGKEGMEKMHSLMTQLRKNPPQTIGNTPVTSFEDYLHGSCPLPKSDVLRFWLEDHTKIVVRPSGTEPKIKIYCGCVEKHTQSLEKSLTRCDQKTSEYIAHVQKLLRSYGMA